MSRPRKWKKVCCLPESNMYGPLNDSGTPDEIIVMAVEEYETIRLIDLEGLTQEECAEKMQVARTTIQKIYNDARNKIAESLVNGKIIRIRGGDYTLCDENDGMHCCGRCQIMRCGRGFSEEEQR